MCVVEMTPLELDERFREFRSYAECPCCGRWDWHLFYRVRIGRVFKQSRVQRICYKCGFGWWQK
ncbi:hypothetical protein SEA_LITTLELAF_100 [Mycobacterium phage LittleLaf]|uniref:Uncharacterized protein n=14 Tax=Marvinvirus TaxID=1982091 RepID=A0A3S9U9H0_9CAUD|nr:hypothetical protein FH33_gp099 [Mycobacterium phage MosMoris]YP_009614215.1 hypothetical protein FDI61_gp097 [Mycobacterium phage Marvin]ANM46324.1 hypothetical protein SEA_GATTACA_102 [Mycobacterium phage Gattaca]AVE00845.1 hypothetical protein SEA_TESLA_99 [Mycobacterium phage Tesla]AYB69904.1 hypothetical protein SEA_LITTLELAF_100 [Mycobacterium phage LittleLaf]AYB70732.1 hypothetical protein SEA_VASUNZINGA_101 [Mycobacterium phage VasuNzinga]AZF93365.1 hypothetical protein SEA_BEELZEB